MIGHHPRVVVMTAALVLGLAQAAAADNPWHLEPPPNDMTRSNFRGAVVNQRTIEMIHRAEHFMADLGHPGFTLEITQGSYNRSVSASAGTHSGGGALDIRTRVHSRPVVDDMVRALRQAGFAAWSRGRGHDSFPPHIHAVAIGDPELSSGALSQVRSYADGRDGLRGNAPDPDGPLGRDAPLWAFDALGWSLPPPPPGLTPEELAKKKAAEEQKAEEERAKKKAAELARKKRELEEKKELALLRARRILSEILGGEEANDEPDATPRRTPRRPMTAGRGMIGGLTR